MGYEGKIVLNTFIWHYSRKEEHSILFKLFLFWSSATCKLYFHALDNSLLVCQRQDFVFKMAAPLSSEELTSLGEIVSNIISSNFKRSIYKWLLALFISKMENILFLNMSAKSFRKILNYFLWKWKEHES